MYGIEISFESTRNEAITREAEVLEDPVLRQVMGYPYHSYSFNFASPTDCNILMNRYLVSKS
jgi:hypothetical protein